MFRPSRLLRTYPRFVYSVARSQRRTFLNAFRRQHDHTASVIQQVQVQRRWTFRRIAAIAFAVPAIALYGDYVLDGVETLVFGDEDEDFVDQQETLGSTYERRGVEDDEVHEHGYEDAGHEDEEDEDDEEDEEDEEDDLIDEDAWFLPLTWAKKLPREYYRGTDPEWREFQMLAGDTDRISKIFNELAHTIYQGLLQHVPAKRSLGRDIKIRRYWLEISFPYGPPQEYSRVGIEVANDYIALTERAMPAQHAERLERMLYPTATVQSMWTYCKTIIAFQVKKIKGALGLDVTAQPGSKEHRMDHMVRMIEEHDARKKGQALSKTPNPPNAPGVGASADNETGGAPQLGGRGNSADSNQNEAHHKRWYMPQVSLSLPGNEAEKKVASMLFHHSMDQAARLKNREPPRGNFWIFGMVQAIGSKASIMFDVVAFYDPKTNQFSMIDVKPRAIKPWQQVPRGEVPRGGP